MILASIQTFSQKSIVCKHLIGQSLDISRKITLTFACILNYFNVLVQVRSINYFRLLRLLRGENRHRNIWLLLNIVNRNWVLYIILQHLLFYSYSKKLLSDFIPHAKSIKCFGIEHFKIYVCPISDFLGVNINLKMKV